MDSENTTLACEIIARIVRPLVTSEDLVCIGRMEGGDDIEFSAETSRLIAHADAQVGRLLNSEAARPMVDAYNQGAEELKHNADERDDDESETVGNEREAFQNWKAIRDKQQSIAGELAKLANSDFDGRDDWPTQLDQRKQNIVAKYLQALLLEEKRRKR